MVGIVREGYNKWERRVPLTPAHVRELVQQGVKVLVQPCHRRVFTDIEFVAAGAQLQDDLSEASLIMGVKAMPAADLLPDKNYLFFSHTIKAQQENMALLDTVLEKRIRLIDYECITEGGERDGPRLVAFGEFAGKAGMINTFRGLGEQLLARGLATPFLSVPSAYMHADLSSARSSVWRMGERIAEVGLPAAISPVIFAFTGNGNVSRGAQGVFSLLPHKMVTVEELPALVASGGDSHLVYGVVVEEENMVAPNEDSGAAFDRADYYAHPERYSPVFHERVAPHVSALINCTYWDQRYPRLLTTKQMQELDAAGRNRMIGLSDISCDLHGSVEFLSRITSVEKPYFGTNPATGEGQTDMDENTMMMCSVDILPSELPREASTHFGNVLLPFVPDMCASDPTAPFDEAALPAEIAGACITSLGKLTPNFEYITSMREAEARNQSSGGASEASELAAGGATATLLLQGHLFDSGLINNALDLVEAQSCTFDIRECVVRPNTAGEQRRTHVVLAVNAADASALEETVSKVERLVAALEVADATCTRLPHSDSGAAAAAAAAASAASRDPPALSFMNSGAAAEPPSSAGVKQTVVIFGAGLVAGPCVEYLTRDLNRHVILVSGLAGEAEALAARLGGNRNISCRTIDVAGDDASVEALIAETDVAVSLLPAPFHPVIARKCINHGKHMVTASYVSDEMRALDTAAKEAGILVMNEVGVDPGMDHMSAMKVIDEVRDQGGRVTAFSSLCGGLPAPEAADNPLGYKFSWSPAGVFSAAKNASRYMLDGQIVETPGEALLRSESPATTSWPSLNLEQLPNRDSIPYGDLYGITDTASTVYRGTLRYAGWSSIMYGFTELGILDSTPLDALSEGAPAQSWAELLNSSKSLSGEAAVIDALEQSGDPAAAAAAQKTAACLTWLGVFSETPAKQTGDLMSSFCALLEERLAYAPMERDMLVMHHEFGVTYDAGVKGPDEQKELITSSLLAYGDPDGETSMARTVGITTAIAVDLVLKGSVTERGMLTPVAKEVYEPALKMLEAEGFCFSETTVKL